MALVAVDHAEVVAASVQQSPGQLAPAFNATLFPHRARMADHVTWGDYTPPALTVTVAGTSWACVPREIQTTLDPQAGIQLDVQYYPTALEALQRAGYAKNIVFLSCPQWQRDIVIDEYNEEDFEVYWHDCDAWISTGWTVAGIFTEIFRIYNQGKTDADPTLQVTVSMPVLHVQNATVICERGQTYFEFLAGLLPGDFQFAWQYTDDTITVSLIEPATDAFHVPAGFFQAVITKTAVPRYTLIEATAGQYHWLNGLRLGHPSNSNGAGGTLPAFEDVEEVETQAEPGSDTTFESVPRQTVITRHTRLGPDGELFRLTQEVREQTGARFNFAGLPAGNGLVYRETTDYTYENDDPAKYQVPRLTESITVKDGIRYQYVTGALLVGFGMAYVLTKNLEVLNYWQYNAITPRPQVLLSANAAWRDAYETVTDRKTYTQLAAASKDWPEGTERTNIVTVDRALTMLLCTDSQQQAAHKGSLYVDCTESPVTVLQQVAEWLQTAGTPGIQAALVSVRTVSTISREVRLASPKTYSFIEHRREFDPQTGAIQERQEQTQIDGRSLPACPSQYRLWQLRTTLDDNSQTRQAGPMKNVIPLKIHVPTNNPKDAEAWWAQAYWQRTHPERTLTISSFDRFALPGSRIAGGTVTGFALSQGEDHQQAATLTII